MIHAVLLFSKQGKVRLAKFYSGAPTTKERRKVQYGIVSEVLARTKGPNANRMCSFIEWRDDKKIVYRRFASLFFAVATDMADNELATLDLISQFVEILDRYFGNVCELDLVFNFHRAYFLLDELLLAGHQQETNKRVVASTVAKADELVELAESDPQSAEHLMRNTA